MNILVPSWLIIAISIVCTISGLVMWLRYGAEYMWDVRRGYTPSKKEKANWALMAGVGTFLFVIGFPCALDFLSVSAGDKNIPIQYIISQFGFWSPLAIIFGVAAAIREYSHIRFILDHRYSWDYWGFH